MTTTDDRRRDLRAAFEAQRGYWSPAWDGLLEADPGFFAAYLEMSSVPARTGPLPEKDKELIFIAVDAAATHLYEPGTRIHVRRAIELGATREELMEVLELTSTLGIHAANIGVPLLFEVLEERGEQPDLTLDARQEELKEQFTRERGYWHEFWHEILVLDPDFFAGYIELSAHPWRHGVLSPKMRELVYCAFDAAATHLYVPGLKLHMRNALGYGATPAEIMEVIEIASTLGIHTCAMAVPIVLEELERAGR
jgi:alkylhydroperoxidase/carboxymuconolactone decarboxylase family protein YurZ